MTIVKSPFPVRCPLAQAKKLGEWKKPTQPIVNLEKQYKSQLSNVDIEKKKNDQATSQS